ncbi:Hypothetical protein NTJ_03557 [Nesidiocoris tenuis]|uniref:Uncharacterized protein n=1 Tax=Nesidiocoris tenuis TaxID=355587 RepID=A0ABN7AHS8_9HEMI|nr:Hypothetical protein NTJ_03557 [Nesidiocoris tenuis]
MSSNRLPVLLMIFLSVKLNGEWVELPKMKPTQTTDIGSSTNYLKTYSSTDGPPLKADRGDNADAKGDYLSDYHNVYDRPFFSDGKDEQWQQLIITKASSPAPPKLQPNYANESSKCLGQQSDERSDLTTMACEEAKPTIATSSSQANDIRNLHPTLTTTTTNPSYVRGENKTQQKPFPHTHLDPLIESIILQVHQTLISHAGQPIARKIDYLRSLQNSMLNKIWRKSQHLWVPGPSATVVEGRGHSHEAMSFPSLEGALLTISFLTFAVFLIKCVRQFIQGMQGTNVTMVAVTNGNRVRKTREALSTQAAHIMRLIDEFHLQHAKSSHQTY